MGLDDLQSPALHFRMSATGKPERSEEKYTLLWSPKLADFVDASNLAECD